MLRALFEKDLALFSEIEKFIQFTGVVKNDVGKSQILKRKIDQCE